MSVSSASAAARIEVSPMEPGYRSALYADSFADRGGIHHLPRSGGWLLERQIPGTDRTDGMGLYPLFCCSDWVALGQDLSESARRWVSVSIVTDPFGNYDENLLKEIFDHVLPYKEHYVADTAEPIAEFVSKSHRENARRSLRKVAVEVCDDPSLFLEDWVSLYAVLARKHAITGLRAFPREAFEKQLRVPGMVMFRAVRDGETVGLDLWYVDGDVAHGHLAAFSEKGYAVSASYATKWTLLNFFADKVRWVNFGGVAGLSGSGTNGLRHFKEGWSNTTRKTFICGRILDEDAYRDLAASKPGTRFFPAYRSGEY